MTDSASNQAIVDRMRAVMPRRLFNAAQATTPTCSGFTFNEFAVTYPNSELMVVVDVTSVPAGVTLFGVTVAAAPSASSSATYCMAVAANSEGLQLPVSVLAASTAPTFSGPTTVTGMVVLSFGVAGSPQQECTVTQQFTVGG